MRPEGVQETESATIAPIHQTVIKPIVKLHKNHVFLVAFISRVNRRSINAATDPLAVDSERMRNICDAKVA